MLRYLLILGFFTAIAFNNCSPNANFTSDSELFSKMADGETVEIVSEQELESMVHDDDEVATNEDDEAVDNDMGLTTDEDENSSTPGGSQQEQMGDNDSDDEASDDDRKRSCRDRLLDQMRNGKKDRMVITRRELEENPEITEAARCGNNRGIAKIWVCHQANGDESKQKPLCLPIPAADSQIARGISLLGYCERGERAGRGHEGKFGGEEGEGEESEEEGEESKGE